MALKRVRKGGRPKKPRNSKGKIRKTEHGRPSKLTDELIEKVVNVLRLGGYAKQASIACGISSKTFYNWKQKGKVNIDENYENNGDLDIFGRFFLACEKAEAEAENAVVGAFFRETQLSWQACAEYLARKYPERWAKNRPLLDKADDKPTEIKVTFGGEK